MSIRQPRRPGGASLNARSPLTATSALRTPHLVIAASASLAAWPLPIAPTSSAIPGVSSCTVRAASSR